MTVDEILATERYTDRRGRGWDYVETVASWCSPEIDAEGVSWGYHYIDPTQMRLLIERDLHRDVCRGLAVCEDHPVPSVNCYFGVFEMWPSGRLWSRTQGRDYHTLSAAMDAARALAVGE